MCWAREVHGVVLGPEHVLFPLAIQHASQIINHSHKGLDGMTAWERAFGRRSLPGKCAPWGEKVLWLRARKKKAQVEEKWHDGIFVGVTDETQEANVVTTTGCFCTRSIRRRTAEGASDAVLFNSVAGSPWAWQPETETRVRPPRAAIDVKTVVDEPRLPSRLPQDYKPSHVYSRTRRS